ncbi:aldo/keto reductase [Sporolactobacillus sp. CQH2019]|uniref:aldo/keto reductase n=1 Tax=Sporolactobacillus sp. CQH2019 TaxID=3023512 RepID=UPI002368C47C|nr:aldo/keto reductase [Sporolactobacillus sp. CQH2019]MDD9149883.1 aldo/keto reductase [Sporolactobacillus sp. CQH2019]
MIKSLSDTVTLNNSVSMPGFGLGVWQIRDGKEVIDSVQYALQAGYRMIDTAAVYRNEGGVGEAIRRSGLLRKSLFVTTKVVDQGYDATLRAFEDSTAKLGIDTIDLYLIHWPIGDHYLETWKAMERLYRDGRVRAIGVSNFGQHHLETLLQEAAVVPAVNQIEVHPLQTQIGLRNYCYAKGIRVESYSPLGSGALLDHPVLNRIAEEYHKSVAQVLLRWNIQNEMIAIPRSTKEEHIVANADIFDFELSFETMDQMDALNVDKSVS